ncbi:MAG: U32 family peptidase [Erysipelotrichaceae bacterium]|nr:U32 family peptidase [Erysipelotrichaceae bacterium]
MFIVSANSFRELEILEQERADGIILPAGGFSLRQFPFLDGPDLEEVISRLKKKEIKVYLNVLRMLSEQDLEAASEFLRKAAALGTDGFYAADEGWIQLALEQGLEGKMIYQPETLIVNAMDADFYGDLGLQAVSLAHELSIEEIEAIARNSHAPLEILVQGRYSWMYSRRPLVSNYLKAVKKGEQAQSGKAYDLQEATREKVMKIMETESGTHVLADEPVQSFSVLRRLADAGIERFRIDSLLEEPEHSSVQLNLYRNALQGQMPRESQICGSDSLYYSQTVKKKEEANG